MGFYVHIHVCFPCDNNGWVADIATKHRIQYDRLLDTDAGKTASWFLESLSTRIGANPGPKGGLSLWGMVGNYTNVEEFCEILLPFWRELLAENNSFNGSPFSFERVVVFEEQEQSNAATAYEIGWNDWDSPEREIVIKKSARLPFAWGQM